MAKRKLTPGKLRPKKTPVKKEPEPEVESSAETAASNRQSITEQLHAAELLLRAKRAHDDFLEFVQFMMPDPDKPDEPLASRYVVKPHHRLMAEMLMTVERGERLREGISIPPQFGKSEQITRLFVAWVVGRNPYRNVMVGTYSQDFANDQGGHVRAYMQSKRYSLVFPNVRLRSDSKAKDHMTTEQGGQLSFLGRGGAGTGKPADFFIIDDPIKDDQEAQSDTIREQTYQWFSKVAYTRCHSLAAIIIVHTRWHEDDLIGRLMDPEHPGRDTTYAGIAEYWKYTNIPAVIQEGPLADALGLECRPSTDPDVIRAFGDGPIAGLWEEKFSLKHLAQAWMLNKRGFIALYMGKPTPEDGDYFKREWFRFYMPADLPANLRFYGASDHAATEKQKNDPSVLGCVGVDEHGNVWVMPDLVWRHMEADTTVEEWIRLIKKYKPGLWFAENDIISKIIGPFLRKKLKKLRIFTTHIMGLPLSGDKPARARSIQGMMANGMVFFPKFASWWPKAENELLKFPNGTHDDFEDFLAWIGRGLDYEHAAHTPQEEPEPEFKSGTIGWIKKSAEAVRKRTLAARANAGW